MSAARFDVVNRIDSAIAVDIVDEVVYHFVFFSGNGVARCKVNNVRSAGEGRSIVMRVVDPVSFNVDRLISRRKANAVESAHQLACCSADVIAGDL
jgi:hypothetical protein